MDKILSSCGQMQRLFTISTNKNIKALNRMVKTVKMIIITNPREDFDVLRYESKSEPTCV